MPGGALSGPAAPARGGDGMVHKILASILVSLFALAPLVVFGQDAASSRTSTRDVGILNINTASQAELKAVPGIGQECHAPSGVPHAPLASAPLG